MWRALPISRSTYRPSTPKAASASLRQRAYAAGSSSALCTPPMPRPPPPRCLEAVAAPAVAVCALRLPESLGLFECDRSLRAGQQRHAAAQRQRPCLALVAEQGQLFRCRADEAQPGGGAGPGEVGALAQKAVAGVQAVATLRPGDGNQARRVEVGRRAGGVQSHGL